MAICNLQSLFTAFTFDIVNKQETLEFAKKISDLSVARHLQKKENDAALSYEPNKRKNYMNTLTAKGSWNIAKGKLKQKFAQLTEDDLQFVEGKEDELIGRIQKRTGQGKEQIERAVQECCGSKH
jgi:uncharacterized protein YjbJ (UPF0337 family)